VRDGPATAGPDPESRHSAEHSHGCDRTDPLVTAIGAAVTTRVLTSASARTVPAGCGSDRSEQLRCFNARGMDAG
jgi:hypothetical protein